MKLEATKAIPLIAVGLTTLAGCTEMATPPKDAFVSLANSYAARDADAAAQNYTDDAIVTYAYDGVAEERFVGRSAIEGSFRKFFGQIDNALPLNLNFRVTEEQGLEANGFYRLRFGGVETSYGRFKVTRNASGLFIRDRSSSATRSDFEEAPAPLLIQPNENELDRGYYGLLAGRYQLPDGCKLVVTRSIVRLFTRNSCDQSWRGLDRVSGLEWTGGDHVLPQSATSTFRFARIDDSPSARVQITRGGAEIDAVRAVPYRTESVSFASADGTGLAGTLYLPFNRARKNAGIVLVHGSGPQDRDGYASIIAVLADALAAEGRAVLTYDKRGSGASQGNGDTAGFDVLAADARSAMAFLALRPEVDSAKIGLGGSSQAGWVVAKAIQQGALPSDVLLLGAAGAAFTVREQNIYNTDVRMECAGIPASKRRIALAQQAAFFDAVADPSRAPRLDTLTREAATDPDIREWLFPDSESLNEENAWFTVLDPAFDPLPVWKSYRGRAVFLFSEHDDSTDTRVALDRLRDLNVMAELLPGAQHLGLDATSRCDSELAERGSFSPRLFEAITEFATDGN